MSDKLNKEQIADMFGVSAEQMDDAGPTAHKVTRKAEIAAWDALKKTMGSGDSGGSIGHQTKSSLRNNTVQTPNTRKASNG